jgi:hypothetical protein
MLNAAVSIWRWPGRIRREIATTRESSCGGWRQRLFGNRRANRGIPWLWYWRPFRGCRPMESVEVAGSVGLLGARNAGIMTTNERCGRRHIDLQWSQAWDGAVQPYEEVSQSQQPEGRVLATSPVTIR